MNDAEAVEQEKLVRKRATHIAVVLSIALIVVSSILVFIVPKFDKMFTELGDIATLPIVTKIVLWSSRIIRLGDVVPVFVAFLFVNVPLIVWFSCECRNGICCHFRSKNQALIKGAFGFLESAICILLMITVGFIMLGMFAPVMSLMPK